jgi:XTP/dITP diphosphohydrolase
VRKIILATRNQGKLKEILQIFRALPVEFIPLTDVAGAPEVVEDGTTFHENASKKAVTVAKHAGAWALGEDSGIEVDALEGRPGIHSSRYAGTDEKNNQKLLRELKGVPDEKRTARYRCVVVVADPEGREIATAEGSCEGRIGHREAGTSGFGYDPLFVVGDFGGKTMAELGLDIKNRISHRARALHRLKEELAPKLR